jgi:HK97 family phage major capsid protein
MTCREFGTGDPYTAKPTVLFTTTKRVGGGVQDFDAIKLMKFAAS